MQKHFLSQDVRKFRLFGHLSTVMIKAKEKDDVGCKSSGGFAEIEVTVVYIKDF